MPFATFRFATPATFFFLQCKYFPIPSDDDTTQQYHELTEYITISLDARRILLRFARQPHSTSIHIDLYKSQWRASTQFTLPGVMARRKSSQRAKYENQISRPTPNWIKDQTRMELVTFTAKSLPTRSNTWTGGESSVACWYES